MRNTTKILAILALFINGQCIRASEDISLLLKVIDSNSRPIENAEVWAGGSFKSKSDKNGQCKAMFKKRIRVAIGAYKEGFYQSGGIPVYPFKKKFDPAKEMVIELKKKKNPIAMYARKLPRLVIPVQNKLVGYDLIIGDWLSPYGSGKIGDLVFLAEGQFGRVIGLDNWSQKITITFSNENDGLIPYEAHLPLFEDNELRSGYEAPKLDYLSSWTQTTSRMKGKTRNTTQNAARNYYFRVRTKLDKHRSIKSSHYGKIYGDFMSFTYYLNPTSNDRNVEFDPKRNLLKNLPSEETVKRP